MGSLVCRVELHKKNGIIITVENDDDSIRQTMVLDGSTITTTCEGDETSVITQTPDSITIKCKDFILDADTINCKSAGSTVHKSGDTFEATSSKAMALNAGTDLAADAGTGMKLTAGKDIEAATSSGDVKISGMNTSMEAKIKAGIDSKTLELKGSIKAKMEGGLVDVTGTKTNVEGSALTTIAGGIIKVG
jgi:hypothetical protein